MTSRDECVWGEGVVDAEVYGLLDEFGDHATVVREVRQVAEAFAKAGQYDKAVGLYEYNVETYPGDANAMCSQADNNEYGIGLGGIGEVL